MNTLNPIGWGYTELALDEKEHSKLLRMAGQLFGAGPLERRAPPLAGGFKLPTPRVAVPPKLNALVTQTSTERLLHALGRSFRDLASLRRGKLEAAPDAVAQPRSQGELLQVLDWAQSNGYAIIPFGGGSSVVGGVTPENLETYPGVVTVSLGKLNRVIEINETDQVVHAEAGIFGPALDEALKQRGLTARHYPQSYYHSTLGGWIAARGAGHYSTLHAKIEDRVQALKVVLPDGRIAETRPLPASSVGPDPNRLWCGSEGALGIITEVRLRVLPVPKHRSTLGIRFKTFEQALQAARAIVQGGLYPAQLRVLDPFEHMTSSLLAGRTASGSLMVLGFESSAMPTDAVQAAALDIAQQHGGTSQTEKAEQPDDGVGDWRQAFLRQPYIRDTLLDYGIISDTFETAVPWSRLPEFYHSVRKATLDAVLRVCGAGGVNCRTTHAYRDGISLYFSFYGRGRHDSLVEQWREIKAAACEAVAQGGGTQSHHHAMGRDHKPWAVRELPEAFRAAIRAAKHELDPKKLMNPGLWFES
ncbi:MAG: FAD-binding oxidoreductase [Nevskiales bacterium]